MTNGHLVANGYSVKPPMFYLVFQSENNTLIVVSPVYGTHSNQSNAEEKYIKKCALSHKDSFGFGNTEHSLKTWEKIKGRTLGTRTIALLRGSIGFLQHRAMMIIKDQPLEHLLKLLTTHFNVVFV